MQTSIVINRSLQAVFDLIADLANYDKWLPSVNTFGAVTDISDSPIRLGTAYVDKGQSITMTGKVTQFEPPTRLAFQQITRLKLLIFPAGLDIDIQYTLTPLAAANGTRVVRDQTVQIRGPLKLAESAVMKRIKTENERILQAMKTYLENPPPVSP